MHRAACIGGAGGYWEPQLLVVFILLAVFAVLVGGSANGAAVHMRWGLFSCFPES